MEESEKRIIISIISPVFKCRECLEELYIRLINTLEQISANFEIIFVNDSSPDGAWETINDLAKKDSRIKGINLSRNFGQHPAINAGLEYASGEWVVIMDCDLQDRPEEIIKLYQKAIEGYDIVFARREFRNDSYVKKLISKLFYILFNYLTSVHSDHTVANFGIYRSAAINEYRKIRGKNKVFPVLVRQIGFKSISLNVLHGKRGSGESAYSLSSLFKLAFDIIVTQSNKPLYLFIYFGFTIALLSFFYGLFLIIRFFSLNVPAGYTSIITAILFIGGLLFCNLGIIGIYLGKVYNETKGLPDYIIQETTFN